MVRTPAICGKKNKLRIIEERIAMHRRIDFFICMVIVLGVNKLYEVTLTGGNHVCVPVISGIRSYINTQNTEYDIPESHTSSNALLVSYSTPLCWLGSLSELYDTAKKHNLIYVFKLLFNAILTCSSPLYKHALTRLSSATVHFCNRQTKDL